METRSEPQHYSEAEQAASEPDFYGKWISVKDKMPNDVDTEYLVAIQEGKETDFVTSMIWDGEEFGEEMPMNSIDWMLYITHWAPMPPLPSI